MMRYIVATAKSWNMRSYHNTISKYDGEWFLITEPEQLTVELIAREKPRYIFFPHWSHIVPPQILNMAECVCFHETPLPFGRGGSPIQNLIASGYRSTQISAIRMTEQLDAGDIYMRAPLSLEGLAEDIFLRASEIVTEMILQIISNNPEPTPQTGEISVFKRRTPSQSRVSEKISNLRELFDHIRMLDAESYPKAFLEYGNLRLTFTRPAIKTEKLLSDVEITIMEENCDEKV